VSTTNCVVNHTTSTYSTFTANSITPYNCSDTICNTCTAGPAIPIGTCESIIFLGIKVTTSTTFPKIPAGYAGVLLYSAAGCNDANFVSSTFIPPATCNPQIFPNGTNLNTYGSEVCTGSQFTVTTGCVDAACKTGCTVQTYSTETCITNPVAGFGSGVKLRCGNAATVGFSALLMILALILIG